MTPIQTACQTFQNQFADLLGQISALNDNLTKFTQTTDQDHIDEFQKRIDGYRKGYDEFMKEYQEKVVALLVKWLIEPMAISQSGPLLHPIDFEETGRIVFNGSITFPVDRTNNYLPTLIRKIRGSLNINGAEAIVPTLDGLEEIEEHLKVENTNVSSMKKLKSVGEGVHIEQTNLTALESLEKVGTANSFGGSLEINNSPNFTSLPRLRVINGSLDTAESGIITFDALENVRSFLSVSRSPFQSAPKLKEVGISIEMKGVKIDDFRKAFPKLETIGAMITGHSIDTGGNELLIQQINELKDRKEIKIAGGIV